MNAPINDHHRNPASVSRCSLNHSSSRRKLSYDSDDVGVSILNDDDYENLCGTAGLDDRNSHINIDFGSQDSSGNEGLSCNQLTQTQLSNKLKCNNSSHDCSLGKRLNWSQTSSNSNIVDCEHQVPQITTFVDEGMFVEEHLNPLSINKKVSMLESDSGSELDWDSFTPPVPGSPSDQCVPDTDCDFEFKSDVLPSSSSESVNTLSSPASQDFPYYWGYFQRHGARFRDVDSSDSASDQVVPSI